MRKKLFVDFLAKKMRGRKHLDKFFCYFFVEFILSTVQVYVSKQKMGKRRNI